MGYPYKLKPIVKNYIWGAETWILSTHPAGLSVIDNGQYAGKLLREVTGELPVLIKIIETHDNLSLQVHPGDDYARRVEGQSGKNEMWFIVDAGPGAELILGTDQSYSIDELRGLINTGEILSAVSRIPVKAGECFTIQAGLIHSIGKGVKLIEVQQPSDITYRIYDYGRVDSSGKPRQLHIDKALDVIDTSAVPGISANTIGDSNAAAVKQLTNWDYFDCKLITLTAGENYFLGNKKTGNECLVVADAGDNAGIILRYDNQEIRLSKYDAIYIPKELEDIQLITNKEAVLLAAGKDI